MKILLMATDFFSKGGIQRYTRYQYRALVELYGKENVFVCVLSPKLDDNIFEEDIEVEYIGKKENFLGKIQYAYQVLKIVKQKKIDLLISTHVQISVIAYISKKLYGTKYMTNVYGLEIWSGLKKRDIIGLLNSDKLIGDCKFILDYIDKNFNYSKDNMNLLYDPVDINIFKPKEKNKELFLKYNIPTDKFIVSTIGRLERNKGHELIIKSLKSLDEKIIYVVVGGGKYDNQYKELAKKEKVEKRVYFVGRVPDNELVDFYNLADVVALLSVFGNNEGEGLPLGLIEASACGKPIIAGNQDGSAEAISKEFPNGFIINPVSQTEFIGVIKKLYSNNSIYKECCNNARKFVINEFDFMKFKAIIQGIINEKI